MGNNGAKLIATTGLQAAVRLARYSYQNAQGKEWSYADRERLKAEWEAAEKLAQDVRALCDDYTTKQIPAPTYMLVEGGFDFMVDYDGADWAVLRGLLNALRLAHWKNIRYGNGQNELALIEAFDSLHELAAAQLEAANLTTRQLRRLALWEDVKEWIINTFEKLPHAVIWLDEWETQRSSGFIIPLASPPTNDSQPSYFFTPSSGLLTQTEGT